MPVQTATQYGNLHAQDPIRVLTYHEQVGYNGNSNSSSGWSMVLRYPAPDPKWGYAVQLHRARPALLSPGPSTRDSPRRTVMPSSTLAHRVTATVAAAAAITAVGAAAAPGAGRLVLPATGA